MTLNPEDNYYLFYDYGYLTLLYWDTRSNRRRGEEALCIECGQETSSIALLKDGIVVSLTSLIRLTNTAVDEKTRRIIAAHLHIQRQTIESNESIVHYEKIYDSKHASQHFK